METIKEIERNEKLTTMLIPLEVKKGCKAKGLQYKHVFLAGYNFLTDGSVQQKKQKTKEIEEILVGNRRLQTKVTELSLKIADMERKNGE